MTCKHFETRLDVLEDYLNGELAANLSAEVETHLAACAECREAVAEARLGSRLLHAALEPAPEATPAFWTRLRAHLDEQDAEQEQAREFWPALEWFARRLALGSAVALLILGAFLIGTEARTWWQPPQPEVTEMVPRPVQPAADHDEILLLLATNGNGR